MSEEEILEQACVSLVRAVIPELPHSSQWKEGDPVTPESVKDLAPGTAIATFEGGRYGNAPHGNHAAIFLRDDTLNGKEGIVVVDQFEGRHQDPGEAKERFYSFEPSRGSQLSRRRFFHYSTRGLKSSCAS